MPCHLLACPLAPATSAALLDRFRNRLAATVLWIAPSTRRAEQLRQWLPTHSITTFADLAEAVLLARSPTPGSPSEGQRRLLVDEIVAELTSQGQFRHYARVAETAGFADGLLGMIDELTRVGVRPVTFARRCYQRGGEGSLTTGRINPADRDRARLFARYQRALRRIGGHDLDGEAQAAVLLPSTPLPLLEGLQEVIVEAGRDLSTGRIALLQALAARVEAICIGLIDEPGDERAELFTATRLVRTRLPGTPLVGVPPYSDPRPVGLVHLSRQLFRPLRRVEVATDPAGLALIQAAGVVGEARLVARRIRLLLDQGIAPRDIDVVVRDLTPGADLLLEVFCDHGIPVEMESRIPLLRSPSVAILLRALRLPDDDFPFAAVTALLRHTFFRPTWPECAGSSDLPQRAEALLRLLAEPRGRDAYLAAIERWAERQQPGLEDEAAEESRRRRTHELASECRPFLVRFFHAWDEAPRLAPLTDHVAWLDRFAGELGLGPSPLDHECDRTAWNALWSEIDAWQTRDPRPLDRRAFQRRLSALAARVTLPRTATGPDRVQVLPAGEARNLDRDHRFVLGMGENGFPKPGGPPSLLDDADREALGLPASGSSLADEMLMFHDLVSRTRTRLTLSYPAVDERGQELLPGSFLLAVRACFDEEVIPLERRRMLIEGYFTDTPLSPAEVRVQAASAWPDGAAQLSPALRASLSDAALVARARFGESEFTPFDGLFRDPFYVEWIGRLFGRERIFSPTALEDYVACPFRFFLRHVLHLEPLDEPREEIEVTRKGMAVHRALARLHQRLRDQGVHQPTVGTNEEVLGEMRLAIDEDVNRAPGPASKVLWQLEGQRLLRSAGRYPGQWDKFLEPWLARGVSPRPHLFEVDFGMPAAEGQSAASPLVIRHGEVEVRLWGRIDRVDLAELSDGVGFWIIDYKTGRSSHYTGTDLASFRKLQLPLYALAVEAVFLAGRKARPLGMAYWLVSESGPKVVLPGRSVTGWLEETSRWPAFREQLVEWVANLARNIRSGAFPLAPRSEHCTQTCPYGQVCRISQARSVGKRWHLGLPGETPLPDSVPEGHRRLGQPSLNVMRARPPKPPEVRVEMAGSPGLTAQQRLAIETRAVSVVLSSGAGCGKTHVLTQRYLSHLHEGAEVGQIVAITFTDRAARQMRGRIRAAITRHIRTVADESEAERWAEHLRSLETAPISTIHAFCGTLLRQHAVEAGLDPRFEVLEEVLASNLRGEALSTCLQRLLVTSSEIGEDLRQLVLLFGWRATGSTIASLLGDFDERPWQRWLSRTPADIASEWLTFAREEVMPRYLTNWVASRPAISRCLALLRRHPPVPGPMSDPVAMLLRETPLLPRAEDLSAAIARLTEAAKVGRVGSKAWPAAPVYEAIKKAFEDYRGALRSLDTKGFDAGEAEVIGAVEVGQRLLRVAGAVMATYRERKRLHGVVDFQDLLIQARDLLRDHPEVRARLQDRYRHLLIDELQDTDPVQMELVEALAGGGLTGGKLFAVGDHKQSIYRFRGADVSLFQELRDRVPQEGRQALSVNFRSQPGILDFVNALFARALEDYEPLVPHPPRYNPGPVIEFLWTQRAEEDDVATARAEEADSIAGRIAALIDREALVVDEATRALRTVRPSDVVLLFRAMSNVHLYEAALRRHGLDYYLVGGRAFFAQQEIHDILHLLRALENPMDAISLAGTLRSPFCCLSDEALFALSRHRPGIWAALFDEHAERLVPASELARLRRARTFLGRWRALKDRLPIAGLLNRVFADSGFDAAQQFEFLGERKLANLWKLIDLARTFDRSGLFGLAEFIARLDDLVAAQPREEQAATQPESADVVRLMTIHQAKGLEFPVVIVPDVAAQMGSPFTPSARWNARLGCVARPPADEEEPMFSPFGAQLLRASEDLEDWNEDLRTLYVACTRPRDYLILSAALELDYQPAGPWMQTLAERFDLTTGACQGEDVVERQPGVRVLRR